MSKQIKPGMLCIVVDLFGECQFPEYDASGRVVLVVRKLVHGEVFRAVIGSDMKFTGSDHNGWVITSDKPLAWEQGVLTERPIGGGHLIPISDPDIELTTEEIKELENV